MSEVKRWALVNTVTGLVENVVMWDGESEYPIGSDYVLIQHDFCGIGWRHDNGVLTAPPLPPPTSEEVLASQSAKLQGANQLAAAQKNALTNRIGVINDAIEFEEATQAELDELPIRQTQLTAWKRYAVLLGRVTTQAGWHMAVEWPPQPTEGMDLSVSAVSARPASAQ